MNHTTTLRQLTMTVRACARCQQDHVMEIVFIAFNRPVIEDAGIVWHYWGQCPTTGEPLLARVEEVGEEHIHFLLEGEA